MARSGGTAAPAERRGACRGRRSRTRLDRCDPRDLVPVVRHTTPGVSGSLLSPSFLEREIETVFGGRLGERRRAASWLRLKRWWTRDAQTLGPASSLRTMTDRGVTGLIEDARVPAAPRSSCLEHGRQGPDDRSRQRSGRPRRDPYGTVTLAPSGATPSRAGFSMAWPGALPSTVARCASLTSSARTHGGTSSSIWKSP